MLTIVSSSVNSAFLIQDITLFLYENKHHIYIMKCEKKILINKKKLLIFMIFFQLDININHIELLIFELNYIANQLELNTHFLNMSFKFITRK